MWKSALHRPMVFHSQAALSSQVDCEKTIVLRDSRAASKPPREHFGSGACKMANSCKNVNFPIMFLTFSGAWVWTPRVDCKVNCKIEYSPGRMAIRCVRLSAYSQQESFEYSHPVQQYTAKDHSTQSIQSTANRFQLFDSTAYS